RPPKEPVKERHIHQQDKAREDEPATPGETARLLPRRWLLFRRGRRGYRRHCCSFVRALGRHGQDRRPPLHLRSSARLSERICSRSLRRATSAGLLVWVSW